MTKPSLILIKRLVLLGILVAIFIVVALPRRGMQRKPIDPDAIAIQTSQRIIGFHHSEGIDVAKLALEVPGARGRLIDVVEDRRIAVVEVDLDRVYDALSFLRYREEVDYAHLVQWVGTEEKSEGRYIVTPEIVVCFKKEHTSNDLVEQARAIGAEYVTSLAWLPGGVVFRMLGHREPVAACEALSVRTDIAFAHPNWLRKLGLRETIPNDPLFGNQWHLKNTGQGGGLWNADINATDAWDITTGAGRTIAIIDTGVDFGHSDIVQTTNGYNPQTGAGPSAADDNASHGTACAGLAAGTGNNGTLLTGVAPSAVIMPIRLLSGSSYGTPTEEAACFVYAADHGADVISNSWGPDGVPFVLPALVAQAFSYVTTTGRGGFGCPIFWAAGNGNESISTDQYVSSSYTIAVGATNNFDVRSTYSDYGSALDLVAPSSGGSRQINTVIPNNTYTSNFGGTSASAPQAAGAAALVLAVNPNLTWLQVRDILRSSANPVQPAIALYDSTGHSTTYGHGRLDVFAAVQSAQQTLPPGVGLSLTTNGSGSVVLSITNMLPGAEFLLGVSTQVMNPIGSGPLFGLGADALLTMSAPLGRIPLHYWANAGGSFYWGATGVPVGFTCQAIAIEVQTGYAFRPSNIVQITF